MLALSDTSSYHIKLLCVSYFFLYTQLTQKKTASTPSFISVFGLYSPSERQWLPKSKSISDFDQQNPSMQHTVHAVQYQDKKMHKKVEYIRLRRNQSWLTSN